MQQIRNSGICSPDFSMVISTVVFGGLALPSSAYSASPSARKSPSRSSSCQLLTAVPLLAWCDMSTAAQLTMTDQTTTATQLRTTTGRDNGQANMLHNREQHAHHATQPHTARHTLPQVPQGATISHQQPGDKLQSPLSSASFQNYACKAIADNVRRQTATTQRTAQHKQRDR